MNPEDNPADERTELDLCIREIHELQEENTELKVLLHSAVYGTLLADFTKRVNAALEGYEL